MSVEVRPLGVKCNIQCQYCYQNPQRDAGNVLHAYDLSKIKDAIAAEDQAFTLFGGEPLLIPERDLEDLWQWGFRKFGANRIQTNGTLINENHIRMFREYNVHVGISVDGPEELNDVRWAGSLEQTRMASAKTEAAMERLCREGMIPTLIITLHRSNATPDKLQALQDWLLRLERLGVVSARLHILEIDNASIRSKYALSDKENLECLLSLLRFERDALTTLRFDLFQEMQSLLCGDDNETSCVWNACDPYTTRAVRGIEGNGQRSNCGRTNKDGIDFVKSDVESFERYLALYDTPQEDGGCNQCRFFLMCKGQCPGTAIDGDWRNRTEHCGVWMGLYHHMESEMMKQGLVPISRDPRRQRLERIFLTNWAEGRNSTIACAIEELSQDQARSMAGEERFYNIQHSGSPENKQGH
jgi:uncharacterized protein